MSVSARASTTPGRTASSSEILAPQGAPEWVYDRNELWNAVEAAERRKDAQLAREIEIGLPIELTREQQIDVVREFAQPTLLPGPLRKNDCI